MVSQPTDLPVDIATLERLVERPVSSLQQLGGGRNSRVYRIDCGGGLAYAVKFYPETNLEGADRLDTEFEGLTFLSANGVIGIPSPVVSDKASRCAIYQYIEGESITPGQVQAKDIDHAVRFLRRLRELNGVDGSKSLANASDSFFSLEEACSGIQHRLNRLGAIQDEGPQYSRLRSFLDQEYTGVLGQIKDWCRVSAESCDMGWNVKLTSTERTLSPSDFGFHNTLRGLDGEIVFLDFEYFGWDDPAKMISDFLLHPAMELEPSLKQRFVNQVLVGFQEIPRLVQRLEIVYALSGLKWCLIILNEFLPDIWQQRVSASDAVLDRSEDQERQLVKASEMLHRINSEYRNFPYSD